MPDNKNWHAKQVEQRTPGQRIADSVANGMGSWAFIIIQTTLVLLWMVLNIIGWLNHWDPYPFILHNLLFSTQAAYAAPIIMMSQNRQNQRDRIQAEEDFKTNVDAKKEIEQMQIALARIETEKLDVILTRLDALDKRA